MIFTAFLKIQYQKMNSDKLRGKIKGKPDTCTVDKGDLLAPINIE